MCTIFCALVLAVCTFTWWLTGRRGLTPAQLAGRCGLITMAAFIFAMYGVGAYFSMYVISFYIPAKSVTNGQLTLASARSHDSGQGSFVWGSGTVNGALTYHVYVKNDDGSITPYQIAGDRRVRLIQDPKLDGVGYWKQTMVVDDLSSAISNWTVFANPRPDYVSANEISVPVGTVRQSFELK